MKITCEDKEGEDEEGNASEEIVLVSVYLHLEGLHGTDTGPT